ncbi:hypothetical protein ABPG75_008645 [Micractinium tetrahymenae]
MPTCRSMQKTPLGWGNGCPALYEAALCGYSVETDRFNAFQEFLKVPGFGYQFDRRRKAEDYRLVFSAYQCGNSTCRVNDPHKQPYSFEGYHEGGVVGGGANCNVYEVLFAGFPFMAMLTTRDLKAGNELLYDYGWGTYFEHAAAEVGRAVAVEQQRRQERRQSAARSEGGASVDATAALSQQQQQQASQEQPPALTQASQQTAATAQAGVLGPRRTMVHSRKQTAAGQGLGQALPAADAAESELGVQRPRKRMFGARSHADQAGNEAQRELAVAAAAQRRASRGMDVYRLRRQRAQQEEEQQRRRQQQCSEVIDLTCDD